MTADGPVTWQNWQAIQARANVSRTLEIPCYTDAYITEEDIASVDLGPYQLLRPLDDYAPSQFKGGGNRLGIVIRMDVTDDRGFYADEWDPTDSDPGQELASLVSLALGIRLRANGVLRVFDPGADPRGYPHVLDRAPYMSPPDGRPLLPEITRGRTRTRRGPAGICLTACRSLILAYPFLSATDARTLVRAARSYQEAVWIAEGDGRQAWLRLIEAVEAAAERWAVAERKRSGRQMPSRPQDRFREFVNENKPKPRTRQPSPIALDWLRMSEHLEAIYRLRSRASHGAVPFPSSMLEPPLLHGNSLPTEKPYLSAKSEWSETEAPMLLHTFEYIVRGALLNWWKRMARLARGRDPVMRPENLK